MTWTYDSADLSTLLAQVRLYSGLTDTNNQRLSDEEIAQLLEDNDDDVYLAAAAACYIVAAQYSATADQKTGDIATWYSKRAEQYRLSGDELTEKAKTALQDGQPFLGASSVADVDSRNADTDWDKGSFEVGLMDDTT